MGKPDTTDDKSCEKEEVKEPDTTPTETADNTNTSETPVEQPTHDTSNIDSRLDAIEVMVQRIQGSLSKLSAAQSVLVESGAIVDTLEDDPSDTDDIDLFNDPNFDTLDLTITD